eukprot:733645-Amphidinium_carterae.1
METAFAHRLLGAPLGERSMLKRGQLIIVTSESVIKIHTNFFFHGLLSSPRCYQPLLPRTGSSCSIQKDVDLNPQMTRSNSQRMLCRVVSLHSIERGMNEKHIQIHL